MNDPVSGPRVLSGPPWRAYLKIADGCNRACAFCTIPRIRGAQRSVAMPELLDEAAFLAKNGAKEISLVAQDITTYHTDIDGRAMLPDLLRSLAAVDGIEWIRMLYAHPADFTDEIIGAMADEPKVLPYLDIPFQHISDRLLGMMKRGLDKAGHERVLDRLRERVPGIAIRTTMIVGHPTETDDEFEELLEFVKRRRFENLGAFVFSPEENTPAFKFEPRVSPDVAEERRDRLMAAQQRISAEILRGRVGSLMPVLVEDELPSEENDLWTHVGRCPWQAPEIDGLTYLSIPPGADVEPGDIVQALITDSSEYDAFGAISEE